MQLYNQAATRVEWIDFAKGISMLFVIIGHMNAAPFAFMNNYYRLFYMPLFFMMSGYLFAQVPKRDDYKLLLNKIIRRLILPCCFFTLIPLIIFTIPICAIKGHDLFAPILSTLRVLLNGNSFGFLPCLAIVWTISYTVERFFVKGEQITRCIIAFLFNLIE